MTSSGAAKVPLLVAVGGAIVILLGFLGTPAELGGLGAITIGTLLSSAARGSLGEAEIAGVRWWRMLVAGALICLFAVPLSLVLETIGGLLAGFGAALVIVAAAFGWPHY